MPSRGAAATSPLPSRGAAATIANLPPETLKRILLDTGSANLLVHVAACAGVHPLWRRLVMRSPAYCLPGSEPTEPSHPAAAGGRAGATEAPTEEGSVQAGWSEKPELREALESVRAAAAEHDDPMSLHEPAKEPPSSFYRRRSEVLATLSRAIDAGRSDMDHTRVLKLGPPQTEKAPIGDMGACALAAALQAMPAPLPFTQLHLFNSKLSEAGLRPVMQALHSRGCPELNVIAVRNNPLGDLGVQALAEYLPPSVSILYAGVSECGDEGMKALAAALPATRIRDLYCVAVPSVGKVGWAALGQALHKCSELRWLKIHDNPGMDVAALTASRVPLPSLELLELSDCELEDKDLVALAAALPYTKSLKYLDVAGNDFSAASEAKLNAAAAALPALLMDC